jgi:hypothetical protein
MSPDVCRWVAVFATHDALQLGLQPRQPLQFRSPALVVAESRGYRFCLGTENAIRCSDIIPPPPATGCVTEADLCGSTRGVRWKAASLQRTRTCGRPNINTKRIKISGIVIGLQDIKIRVLP